MGSISCCKEDMQHHRIHCFVKYCVLLIRTTAASTTTIAKKGKVAYSQRSACLGLVLADHSPHFTVHISHSTPDFTVHILQPTSHLTDQILHPLHNLQYEFCIPNYISQSIFCLQPITLSRSTLHNPNCSVHTSPVAKRGRVRFLWVCQFLLHYYRYQYMYIL